MVSFRVPGVRWAGAALLQVALWLLATGMRKVRGCSTRGPPPPRGGRAEDGARPGSKPRDPGQGPIRELLTEALAPRRLVAYAYAAPSSRCLSWLRVAEESDRLSSWMRLSCYEAQDDVSRLLQAWVARARPAAQDLARFSRRIVSEQSW